MPQQVVKLAKIPRMNVFLVFLTTSFNLVETLQIKEMVFIVYLVPNAMMVLYYFSFNIYILPFLL